MSERRIRVGIVGLNVERGWAAAAHVPALRTLSAEYEIVGVANSSHQSALAAAKRFDVPQAFESVAAMVQSTDIDLVVVTVKVPQHLALVTAALEAGKHVYCEWPLGNGLAEARTLARLAQARGVRAVVGTQARMAPEIIHLRTLVRDGYVGEVLSTTLTATGAGWGGIVASADAYTLDITTGATLLTIPLGHTLAALTEALGPFTELSAVTATRRTTALVADTGQTVPMTAEDQVVVAGLLEGGAPVAVHYRGAPAHGPGLVWEVNGTKGDLRITGPGGHSQLMQLALFGATSNDEPWQALALPPELAADAHDGPVAGNVRRIYAALAHDLRHGTKTAPTFDDAVETHRLIAAIERAAATGERTRPDAF